ncbi:MAG TPA: PQQ-dependent sugar dehydrogenase [Anseongella sp.]|nr:PQQ-dependent sugar dehydrogenase [Anseongella sp.]
MKKVVFFLVPLAFLSAVSSSCYRMRTSNGGGQAKTVGLRFLHAADISLNPGYKIEMVARGLTFPSSVAFDDKGRLYVIEAGYSYGEVWREPKLIGIGDDGTQTVVATGARNGPWTGVTFHKGFFYIAEGGQAGGGRILKVSASGGMETLVEGLPGTGDHHTNGPVIKDGYVYFGQGTATNSGIVGLDNAAYGWLKRKNDFHDIPCEDVILAGRNYTTPNVLTRDTGDSVTTGAYSAFGTPTSAGQVIPGRLPCTGAIMKVPLGGGRIEVVAWGLRNPFGLAFSPGGRLYVTENGYDDRGSRPVWGAGDVLWEIKPGVWYGWPDFSAGRLLNGSEEFKVPGKKDPAPLLQQYPNIPPHPAAIFGVHSSSNGLYFSTNTAFGYEGEAFVAQFGDMAPETGKVLSPVGFKVVRVNVENGVIRDFAVNKGKRNGPASWLKSGGFERPLAVKFNPSGEALYVVDFGVMKMNGDRPKPQAKTGVIWKITKEGS